LCGAVLPLAALLGATVRPGAGAHRAVPAAAPPVSLRASLLALGLRRPTFVLFQSGTSSVERQFLAGLRRDGPARGRDDLRVVLLNSLDSPTARRFAIRETPTLLALEPGGHEMSRRLGPEAITAALAASAPGAPRTSAAVPTEASCRVWRGPRLRWVEESDPRARRVYRRFGGGRWGVPDIFKAMSLRPELMEKVLDLSETGHFSDGYLDRKTKERIATFVSALNGSHYCVGSHAGGLRDLGARSTEVATLARGDLDAAPLSPRERALFEYLRRLTLKPGDVTDADLQRLKALGWRDEQIFEAAFDASLFALFNRVAITYGLDYPPDGWQPSPLQLRTALRPTR
jgi:uncharacterized peroxidase-related enzyme